MSTEDERMHILEMIESGKITPSQGLVLLDALDGASEAALLEQATDENEGQPAPEPETPLPEMEPGAQVFPSDDALAEAPPPEPAGEEASCGRYFPAGYRP
jgi:hypothetical protein